MNSKIIFRTYAALVLIILAAAAAFADDKGSDLAFVVNKACTADNITTADLVKVFNVEKFKNGDGVKYVLGTFPADTPEKKCVLEKIYKMSDADFDKFFLQQVFAGNVQSAPKVLSGAAAVKAFVSSSPGAICYMKASEVDASVKVLKVDGKAPGDADYPLKLK